MSIFSETMVQAITEYRGLLRRHLNQVDRMVKLQELGLRNIEVFESDVALYEIGMVIVNDISENMSEGYQGYYSYSGVRQFCEYLREYLANYMVENDQVVHRAQKASRAVLEAVQYMSLPRESLDEMIVKKMFECNKTVAFNGSSEQCEMLMQTLGRQQMTNPGFYTRIIAHLESVLLSKSRSGAAA